MQCPHLLAPAQTQACLVHGTFRHHCLEYCTEHTAQSTVLRTPPPLHHMGMTHNSKQAQQLSANNLDICRPNLQILEFLNHKSPMPVMAAQRAACRYDAHPSAAPARLLPLGRALPPLAHGPSRIPRRRRESQRSAPDTGRIVCPTGSCRRARPRIGLFLAARPAPVMTPRALALALCPSASTTSCHAPCYRTRQPARHTRRPRIAYVP